ncbi:MAG: ester cyclase [Thermomicrobiales bacterium]
MSIETNKQLAITFFEEIWNQKDESAIDRYVAENAAGNDKDFGVGREDFRVHWKSWIAAFPDLHFEIVDLISEGDKVLTRWTLTGTFEGELFGKQGDGRKIRVDGMSLDRIENGMVAEGFDGWDNYGFRQQLGVVE